jgi:ABC-type glycerol-3-phosphate transport system substrate-binding protein
VQFAKLAVGGNFGTQSLDDFDLAVYMADGKARTSIIWSGYAMALANSGSATDALQDLRFGAVPGIPLLGAWLLAAPANRSPSQQKLAADFIKFATSRKQMEDAAKLGSPPPRKSVLTSAEFRRQYRLSSAAQEQSLETAWPRPRWQDWKEVERQMGDCLSDLSAVVIGAGDAWDAINGVILPSPGKASGTRRTGCASHVVEAGDFRQR